MPSNVGAAGDVGTPLEAVEIVFVAEDGPWTDATARRLAGIDGVTVETVHSIGAGRRRFDDRDPACVVRDSRVTDGDGPDLFETVRDVDPQRPFVFVTGPESDEIAGGEIGGDGIIDGDGIARGVTDVVRRDRDDAAALLANRVATAVRTYRAERALASERRGREALFDVLTATTTRDELFEELCRRLVAEGTYDRAWIGTSEGPDTVVPVASAGSVDDRGPPIVAGGSPNAADHPAVGALDEDAAVVIGPLAEQFEFERADGWWERLRERHVEHVVAVPIGHDRWEGVVVIEATTPIDDADRRRLRAYADVLHDVLRAGEWVHPSTADGPVSIAVPSGDVRVPLVGLAETLGTDVRIAVPAAVDRGDGTTLYLAHVEGIEADAISAAVESIEGIAMLGIRADRSRIRCELLVRKPTPERVVVEHGGRFEGAVVEGDTTTVTAAVPNADAISEIVAAIEDTFGAATVVGIRGSVSDAWSRGHAGRDRLEGLTDRQRDVLLYAFHAGYYENPRGVSATELAERFDVARATLTQHLRTAERKVFHDVLTE